MYNNYIDPVSILIKKTRNIFIEKTELEKGVLPTVLLNPHDCVIIAWSIKAVPFWFLIYDNRQK